MSRIRGKNTKPELMLRSLFHREGFRFRLHAPDLPGKPDIVFPKYRTVIFVHGCYWHRHEGCPCTAIPKSRAEFWQDKFRRTVERDQRNQADLEGAGWKVLIAWECELKTDSDALTKLLKYQMLREK